MAAAHIDEFPTIDLSRSENKSADAKEVVDAALADLAEALEQGKSDHLETFLRTLAKFPQYSWGNVALILSQRPDATRVAGYQMWKSFGRQVLKGEKGIVIFSPIIRRVQDADIARLEANDTPIQGRILAGFKTAHVFDVAQTTGKPLPALGTVTGDPGAATAHVKALIQADGISLETVEGTYEKGSSSGGHIQVRSGLEPAEEFRVLVHEYAHEKLHPTTAIRQSLPKHVKETEAEAVGAVVSHAVGLQSISVASDYIQLWQGDVKTLGDSLSRIQRTAHQIILGLRQRQQEHQPDTSVPVGVAQTQPEAGRAEALAAPGLYRPVFQAAQDPALASGLQKFALAAGKPAFLPSEKSPGTQQHGILLGYTTEVAGFSLAAVDVGDRIRGLVTRQQDIAPGRTVQATLERGGMPHWKLKEVGREQRRELDRA